MSLTWNQFKTEVKLYLHLYNEVANIQTLIDTLIASGAADMQRGVPYYQTGHVDSYEADDITQDGFASFLTAPNGKIRSVRLVKVPGPTTVIVSGAGTDATNAEYVESGTESGRPQYLRSGGDGVLDRLWAEGGNLWTISGASDDFYVATTTTDTLPPWQVAYTNAGGYTGLSPAPTVTLKEDTDVFRSLTQVDWSRYHKMRAGEIDCGKGYVAINPVTRQMAIVPQLNAETKLYIEWDGIKTAFGGSDVTPFDARMAEAVGYFTLARISRVTDKDMPQHASYEREYVLLKKKIASDQNWNRIITGTVPSQLDSVQPTVIE